MNCSLSRLVLLTLFIATCDVLGLDYLLIYLLILNIYTYLWLPIKKRSFMGEAGDHT